MSKTKLTDLVHHEGEITTIAELDKRGLITYRKVDNFYKRKGTVYFADIKGTMDGWEIGKLAYQSRTGQHITLTTPTPKAITPKPPAGSGLQMQSSFGGGGGQTYFAGSSPKRKGKKAAKKNLKKKEKKGSGSLAAFGVMPEGQTMLPVEGEPTVDSKKFKEIVG